MLALAVSGGDVYAGGDFTSTGGQTTQPDRAANTDGTLDPSWNPDANAIARVVSRLAVSGGDVYVGGDFT